MKVEITNEYIGIFEEINGEDIEIVYWDKMEWEEDPSIVVSIANAVHLAHTNPEYLDKLLRHGNIN